MPALPSPATKDPLGEALGFLRLTETAYYHSELTAPWALAIPENCPKFHFIAAGRCWLQLAGGEARCLEAGDFVVVPHGIGHRLASALAARALNLADLAHERISRRFAKYHGGGGGGETTTIICGDLNFTHPAAGHLVSVLPRLMHVRASANHARDWLQGTMRFMAVEARDLRPGAEAILTRLADILVIQAIRDGIEQTPAEQKGWLAALQDPAIGQALGLLHDAPEKNWTIARLARAVGLSRTAFAARFSALVRETVQGYLTRWRMHLAHVHLRDPSKSLDDVAALLGYQSAAAFSRAFHRFHGVRPGALRRREDPPLESAHRYLQVAAPHR
jgi:AraC-like DNA-binding protein